MRLFAMAAIALALPQSALAWGPTGHRTSAEIAENHISGRTRAEIALILGAEGLPEASTWPDEQRSNPDAFWQESTSPLHYVTLPRGAAIGALVHPPEGDAATALDRFAQVLRDPAASREEKALALRFTVHLVADLHMPLHVGFPGDRGGNDAIVSWFDAPTNLHWVWDEGMILRQQLSYSEYAARLDARTGPDLILEWWDADPATWMAESAELREHVYPAASRETGLGTLESPFLLGYRYHWQWMPTVEQRLAQSGVRLAAYLDRVFARTAEQP